MDISISLRKLRKTFAVIGMTTILSSFLVVVPTASAVTVPSGQYYTDAVQQLVDDGTITQSFSPSQSTSRCVFAKFLVGALGITMEEDYTASFPDVPSTHLCAGYIYTAQANAIVEGNPDGTFRPDNAVTRLEAAVMLTRALGLEEDVSAAERFPDWNSAWNWAAGSVGATYNAGIFQGDATTGNFRGADSALFVETAVLVVRAASGGGAVVGEGEGEGEVVTPPAPAGGTLAFALSSTPAGSTLPTGAKGVQVLQFSVSAGSTTTLDTLKFTRSGVGAVADFSAVYVYEGASRLKSGKTISSDTNTVEFTNLSLTVEPNAPRIITVKADVAASPTSNDQHSFSIASASDVGTNGTATGLPLQGSTFTIGAVAVGTVTVQTVTTISGPTLGASDVECGNFRLSAAANDIKLHAITLTHGGTISRSNLGNFMLVQPGYTAEGIENGVIATASTIDSNDRLTFVPGVPFAISKNQNRNFEVHCDILGGKTTETLQFYLDEVSDINVVDQQYGFGSNITNSLGSSNVTAVSLQGGKLTFADNGPNAQNMSTNSTNKQLFNFSVSADRNVTVRDFWVLLEQTTFDAASGGATPQLGATAAEVAAGSISTAGAVTGLLTDSDRVANLRVNDVVKITDADTANLYYVRLDTVGANTNAAAMTGTVLYPANPSATVTLAAADSIEKVYDNHLITTVKNIKVVDLDTGGTIGSKTNSTYAMSFSDDFDILAGQTRHLSVQADLDSSLVAANAFKAGIDFDDTNYIRDNDANEFLTSADIVAGNVFGKTMTAVASSLTVTLAATPVSETHVKGQSAVDAVGLSVRAGDGGAVKVTRVNVRLFGDATTPINFGANTGDTAANGLVTSVGLYKVSGDTFTRITGSTGDVGMTLVGTIGSANGYYRAQFNNLSHTVAASDTEKWVVRVNLSNTISATRYLAVDIDPDDDIVAQDVDGNTVTAGGASTLNVTGATPTVTKTVATAGTLALSELGSPNASIVNAGATGNVVTKLQFAATNEAFKVTKLNVQLPESSVSGDPFDTTAGTTVQRSIVRVKVRYTNSAGTTETKEGILSAGVAQFTGMDLLVAQNATATMEILADTNTIAGGGVTGDAIRLGVSTVTGYTFEAVGQGSSATLTTVSPTNQANTNSHTMRKAQPIVAKATTGLPSSLTNGTVKVYGFTVQASGGPIALKRIVFTLNASLDAADTLSQFKLYRGTQDLSDNVSIYTKYGTNAESTTDITSTSTTVSEILTVSWDDTTAREETVSSGTTNTYYLEANISGASTGNNLTVNIADDTVAMTATNGVDEFAGTASHQGNVVVWRYDRGATDDTTTCTDDFIYADLNGDGDYTAAADYTFTAANTTEPTCTAAPQQDAYLAGRLILDTNSTDDDETDDKLYWDLNADGNYAVANDPASAVGATIGPAAGNAANALGTADVVITTQTLRSETAGCTGVYIDFNTAAGSAGVYDVANDYCFTMTQTTVALAEDTELTTSNMNFVWSDQGEASGTVHATTTSAWTNGLNVDNLATGSLSLSF